MVAVLHVCKICALKEVLTNAFTQQACPWWWHRWIQDNHVEQTVLEFPSDQDESRMCTRTVGRPAARTGIPSQPKPWAGLHSEC